MEDARGALSNQGFWKVAHIFSNHDVARLLASLVGFGPRLSRNSKRPSYRHKYSDTIFKSALKLSNFKLLLISGAIDESTTSTPKI